MFEFDWPFIFLLLPLPLLVFVFSNRGSNQGIAVPPRLQQSIEELGGANPAHQLQRIGRLLLVWLAWVFLLTAIAQPYLPQNTSLQSATGRSMVVVADLSESMSKTDFLIKDQNVNRLAVVKAIAGQFILGRAGDRIGLVLFGDEAFIGSTLSFDLNSVNEVLQSSGIGMAGKSTAIGDALGLAIQLLHDDTATEKAIILLSDGTNLSGTAEPEDAARLAGELSIRVHTIGMGSDDSISAEQLYLSASADLDEATLQAVAEASGGSFFRARTSAELQEIYNVLDELESTDTVAPPVIVKRDYRNLFILGLLVCMLLLVLPKMLRQ